MRQSEQRHAAQAAEGGRGQVFSIAASPSELEAEGLEARRGMLDFGAAPYGTDSAW